MKTKLILMSLFLGSSIVHGAILPISNKTELQLGHGANSLTEQTYDECITYDKEVFEDGSSSLNPGDFTANSLPVKIEQITSYEQMSKYTSQSISASVSYSFVSASMAYSSSQGSNMFSDQASVGIDVSADYGRFFLANVKIKPELRLLTRSAFYAKCGREFVAGYRLGQGVRVKMSVSASATSSYSQMAAAVGAAVNVGAVGVGLAGTFAQASSSLLAASSLQVDMMAYGAGHLKNVNGLIATENDAVKFRNLISQYVAALEPKNAIRTAYITRPYFPEDNTFDPMLVEVQRQTVQSLYSDFAMLMQNKARIESATRNGKLRQFMGEICSKKPTECENYIRTMEQERQWISDRVEELRQRANACIAATKTTDCQTYPEVHILHENLQSIIWPIQYRYQLMQIYLEEIRNR